MINFKARKTSWGMFLDPTKPDNWKLQYQKHDGKLTVSNSHWLLTFPWGIVPPQFQGYFPKEESGFSNLIENGKQQDSNTKKGLSLPIFLRENASRGTVGLEIPPVIWADPRAALLQVASDNSFLTGVNLKYLDAILNLYTAVSLVGTSPTDAVVIKAADETVGLIMPLRGCDPTNVFTKTGVK